MKNFLPTSWKEKSNSFEKVRFLRKYDLWHMLDRSPELWILTSVAVGQQLEEGWSKLGVEPNMGGHWVSMAPQYANKLNLIPKMMTFLLAPENGIIIITNEKLDSPHLLLTRKAFKTTSNGRCYTATKRTLPRASHELLHIYGFLHDL